MNTNDIGMFASTELTFTTRESYLAWRSEWRSHYKILTNEIREAKKEINSLFASGEYAGYTQASCQSLRGLAFSMMESRVASKLRAGEQYRALKSVAQQIAA